jgi:hypothetical protein
MIFTIACPNHILSFFNIFADTHFSFYQFSTNILPRWGKKQDEST